MSNDIKDIKQKIEYEMPNGKTFQYNGFIISQDNNLMIFKDDIEGEITLNVKRIILIKKSKGGSY